MLASITGWQPQEILQMPQREFVAYLQELLEAGRLKAQIQAGEIAKLF